MEPKCPDSRSRFISLEDKHEVVTTCDLNGKSCLVEQGQECEIYNEWLKEEQDVET